MIEVSEQLPYDLSEAENQAFHSLERILKNQNSSRISITYKFEGIRISPVAQRLYERLKIVNPNILFLWPDAGSTALARRDSPDNSSKIFSFKEIIEGKYSESSNSVYLTIAPKAFDYEVFYKLCNTPNQAIIMLNGSLEDTSIGIGSVGRERRKEFISNWLTAYWVEPVVNGALIRMYPSDWKLFKLIEDKYNLIDTYTSKPNSETIQEALL